MVGSSGTYNFFLNVGDIVFEALDRCEIRPPAITGEHMQSSRRSINLELQTWGNRTPNLWEISLFTIPLVQGVSTYNVPSNVIAVLDTYVRTYQLSNTFNVTPDFTTTQGSSTVIAVVSNNGLLPGFWFQVTTPVAIDGLLLYGFYQVVTVIDSNTFTFVAGGTGALGVSGGGTLAQFVTFPANSSINVALANHGQVAGGQFNVAANTNVGGIVLFGNYLVVSVSDANNFVIQSLALPSLNDTEYENAGLAQILGQPANADPIDRIMTPQGRTDYAMYPDKFRQGIPTIYWFNRQINPTLTVWNVPDGYGPYLLSFYAMTQVQDANPGMGETPNIPYRFLDALCAGLAARLAVKYAKAMLPVLEPMAKAAWLEAATEDRERAEQFILPDLGQYFIGT